MTDATDGGRRAVFIVRLDRDAAGQLTGVVEQVRTGRKTRVQGLEDVGRVLAAMLATGEAEPPREARRPDPDPAQGRDDRDP